MSDTPDVRFARDASAADFLDAFAKRVRHGPRPRGRWEAPIPTHQWDGEDGARLAIMVEGLAGSLRAGVYFADLEKD